MLVILGMLNPNLGYIWGLLLIIASQEFGHLLSKLKTVSVGFPFHIRHSFWDKTSQSGFAEYKTLQVSYSPEMTVTEELAFLLNMNFTTDVGISSKKCEVWQTRVFWS